MSARALIFCVLVCGVAGKLALTPPMGWMSWEIFRCQTDCATHPDACINEALYKAQADAMVSGGYKDVGYVGIHIDDCWMEKVPARDHEGKLVPNKERFPNGMKSIADYMHAKGVKFSSYTAESATTCAGYPASKDHEDIDAKTFASWDLDYLKVDGCGAASYYPTGYAAMGKALQNSGRDIVYSCSWPAYLGKNESTKPYQTFIDIGCNLWRNYDDIQCNWNSLLGIIEHWGQWGQYLSKFAGPGHWNDPDMLLIGNDCITEDEAKTQMALWSIWAAPLIMGNDLRKVVPSHAAILKNTEAIAVDQDVLGKQGWRYSPQGDTEVWARPLAGGDWAVGLFNKNGGAPPPPPKCDWNVTKSGYLEACGGGAGNIRCFTHEDLASVQKECCDNQFCAGLSYDAGGRSGCLKKNSDCGEVHNTAYTGYNKPGFHPPKGSPANITVAFSDIGLSGSVKVRDIWAMKDVGHFTSTFTAEVPFHGTGFFRLSKT